jgi:hypothetical protein
MLERPPSRREAARTRQQRSRARRRQGLKLVRITQDEFRLIEALQRSGRLTPADGLQWPRVEQAVEQVLQDWVERWSRVAFPDGL